MAKILGKPTDILPGSTPPIQLPKETQPTPILLQSGVERIRQSSSGEGIDEYKVKANVGDLVPGFLDAKIGVNFSIQANKITLDNLTGFDSDDLFEGSTNLYFTQTRFDTAFGLKSTTDLAEGSNLYYTDARVSANSDVAQNTIDRHTHVNKSILDLIDEPFTGVLKTQYDGYSAKVVNGVTNPITFVGQVIAHSNDLGFKHVPDDTGVPQGYLLSKGASDGVYSWIAPTSGGGITLDPEPTTSTTSAVQSAWVKNHNENSLTNVKHLTDTQLTSVVTTFPNHISNSAIHLPGFGSGNANKYLRQNTTGDGYIWDDIDTTLSITGENYISILGTVITASKINLSQTNVVQGTNISISGNTISAIQRAIDQTPTSGNTNNSISSDWANSHINTTGSGSHIPTGGTSDQYVGGDGVIRNLNTLAGSISTVILGAGGPTGDIDTRIASGDTSVPSGWSIAKNATVQTDLDITHTTGKKVVDVTIFADDGTDITKLIGTAAFTTIIGNQANTVVKIASLATIDEKIYIYLQFE